MTSNEKFMESLFTPVIKEAEQESKIVSKINLQKEEISKTEGSIEKFRYFLTQQTNMLNYFNRKVTDIENKSKILSKIKIQEEEMNKTEDLLKKFQVCLVEQNNMLNQFCLTKNKIRNHIKELLENIITDHSADESDDGDWLIYLDKLKSENKVLTSSIDKYITRLFSEKQKGNLKRISSENVAGEKKKARSNQNITDKNLLSILVNPDFKKYKLKLVKTFEENVEITQLVYDEEFIIICGANGFLMKYFTDKSDSIKSYETNIRKTILNGIAYQDLIYAFNADEMFCFDNRSKLNFFHFFNCQILNISKRSRFIFIFLENGSLFKFHFAERKLTQIYWTKEILKKMFFLQSDYYLMLTKDERVKILQGSSKINHLKNLYGTRDIREMGRQRTLFIKDKSIAVIDNMKHEIISALNTSDCIQFAEIFNEIGVILDEKNKLHVYSYRNCAFEKLDCIEFAVGCKITAIVITKSKDIYIAINNQIYKFCVNE